MAPFLQRLAELFVLPRAMLDPHSAMREAAPPRGHVADAGARKPAPARR